MKWVPSSILFIVDKTIGLRVSGWQMSVEGLDLFATRRRKGTIGRTKNQL